MNGARSRNAARAMLKAAAVTLLILLMVLVSGRFRSSASDEPVACTEIGCSSGLFARLGNVRQAFPEAASVKICLRERCRVIPRRMLGSVQITAGDLAGGRSVSVRMVIRDSRGRALARSAVRPVVSEVRPNGEGCPPVCRQVQVTAGADGLLRAA